MVSEIYPLLILTKKMLLKAGRIEVSFSLVKTSPSVVSHKMVVGIDQASGYLVLDEGRMGAGHQRIDIHVEEEYRNI
jgi:hypothetical protein